MSVLDGFGQHREGLVMIPLYPFQRWGVDEMKRILTQRNGVLLADEAGLGKTPQFLTLMAETARYPALVICPAVLKLQWAQEAKRFVSVEALNLYGRKPYLTPAQLRARRLVIINYEILGDWLETLQQVGFKLVGTDECHRVGATYGKQSVAWRVLCRDIPKRVCMSGTPLRNYAAELWPIVSCLWPLEFDSIFDYMDRYCEGEKIRGRWKWSGARNVPELNERLKRCGFIRRMTRDVLPDLPVKRKFVIPLELSNADEYKHAEDDFVSWLATWDVRNVTKAARAIQFTKFSYMKRLSAELKLPAIFDWLDNWLSADPSAKAIVGAIHRKARPFVLNELALRYTDTCVQVHGDVSEKDRQLAQEKFRDDPGCRLFIGQYSACGEGLNLQSATCVVHTELAWNSATHLQFGKRAHRIGQTSEVSEYFLVAKCEIEERLAEMLQRKERWINRILDGEAVTEQSLNLFDELGEAILRSKKP
jgi:SWI/SNF-related matrix-associated actin-dependent regulator 1 of chromatin subfamily A